MIGQTRGVAVEKSSLALSAISRSPSLYEAVSEQLLAACDIGRGRDLLLRRRGDRKQDGNAEHACRDRGCRNPYLRHAQTGQPQVRLPPAA